MGVNGLCNIGVDLGDFPIGVNDPIQRGISRSDLPKSGAHAGVIVPSFVLKAVFIVATRPRPLERYGFGEIENDDQGWLKVANDQSMYLFDRLQSEFAGNTLKGSAGIGITIADNPFSGSERRPDGVAQMCSARRIHQQQFGHGIPFVRVTFDQQLSYILRCR